jgi:hypothetical protein
MVGVHVGSGVLIGEQVASGIASVSIGAAVVFGVFIADCVVDGKGVSVHFSIMMLSDAFSRTFVFDVWFPHEMNIIGMNRNFNNFFDMYYLLSSDFDICIIS